MKCVLSNCITHHFSSLDKQKKFSSNNNYRKYFTKKPRSFPPVTKFSWLNSWLHFLKKNIKFRTFSVIISLLCEAWISWTFKPGRLFLTKPDHGSEIIMSSEPGSGPGTHCSALTQCFSCACGEKGKGICGAITCFPSPAHRGSTTLCQSGAEQWLSSITATTAWLSWEADRDGWPGLPDQ